MGCGAENLNFLVPLVPICSVNLWAGNGISGAKSTPTSPALSCGLCRSLPYLYRLLTVFTKLKIPFMFHCFFFVLISVRAYGLHIWEMLSMVAPNPPYTPHPHTHCFCEVIHIWSSLLLLIITHDYYKQVLSWLAALSLLWKGNNVDFQDFKQTQELWRNDSESY